MNNTTNTDVAARPGNSGSKAYRPRLAFYHPSVKGTGCAMQMELHPAHDDTDGSIMMSMANQISVGDPRAAKPNFPRFDWENKITVKLDFADLSKMLQVFRGECESIEDGKGLYHRSPSYNTRIVLRHLIEPMPMYCIDVYRTAHNGSGESRARMALNTWEATGLAEAIAGSMAIVSFGIPMVIPHDTSAYAAEVRRSRNVVAA